jgi:hypothetical protein
LISKLRTTATLESKKKVKTGGAVDRHKSIPAVTTSYQAEVGAWHGTLRVTVCWRELLYTDDTGAEWVKSNVLF